MPAEVEEFFARPVVVVARDLVGATFAIDGVGGRVVEVEAYAPDDAASHSFRGPTVRNGVMFGPPARLYVYRSYGIHWMLNLVCEPAGRGAAVLLRALEPLLGVETIEERRPGTAERDRCRGPGRLGVALAIAPALNGAAIDQERIVLRPASTEVDVTASRRIGISRDVDRPWRFSETGSRYVSGARSAPR